MTLLETIKKTDSYFHSKKIKESRLTTELLLSHLLKCKRIDLYLNFDKPLSTQEIDSMRSIIKRKVKGEPIQYITGKTDFYDITLNVNSDVLIPRPETEILIENVINNWKDSNNKQFVDIGTGSGAIAICLKKHLSSNIVCATDISDRALATAKKNAELEKVEINWILSNMFENIEGNFDVIISNPPYIISSDIKTLEREVKDFEPLLALDGGKDGLEFYKKFIPLAVKRLNSGGEIYFEVGDGQADDVAKIGVDASLKLKKVIKDLAGKERVVVFGSEKCQ